MRALILHGADDLRLESVPDPEPGPGEVVLAVEYALTCATDAKMLARGVHPALPRLPAPFGHEAVGQVVAIGPGVTGVALGERRVAINSAPCLACPECSIDPGRCRDRTYLMGAFAERLRIPAPIVAAGLLPAPAGLDPRIAAMAEPLACAVRAIERARTRPGAEAIVLGGGPQGMFLTMLLARRGVRVVVCDPHVERRALARRFGAVRGESAPRAEADLGPLRATSADGLGPDLVFAAVGRPEVWELAIALARPGGEVHLHGGCAAGTVISVPAARLHYDEVTLRASYHHTPETTRTALALIAAEPCLFGALLGAPIGLHDVAAVLRAGGPKRPVAIATAT